MPISRTVTVALPEALYERIRETVAASSLSLEEALTQFIALSVPELEKDLPSNIRLELAPLPLFSDAELWAVAKSMVDEKQQDQLESLVNLQKQRPLTETEQSTLDHLMDEAHRIMLRKAEAFRLLARRGYTVFETQSEPDKPEA